MAIKIAGVDVINDDRELVLAKLTDINETVNDTAVDVFIYDTSKDSDGGAWRHRTQHTSWYNEGASSTRGSRKEFPAVAVIVAEATKVTIYDGDDPSLPMWMIFPENKGALGGVTTAGLGLTSVAMLNGVLVGGYGNGLSYVNFLSEVLERGFSVDTSNVGVFPFNVSERDQTPIGLGGTLNLEIVNANVNDVAMTVLPDAPTDPATGLPVPTIAVATDGGVSVIKDDGTVVDITHSFAADIFTTVSFTDDNRLATFLQGIKDVYVMPIPTSDYSVDLSSDDATYNELSAPYLFSTFSFVTPSDLKPLATPDGLAIIRNETDAIHGISQLAEDTTTPANGMVAYTTSTYNTGWMNGDIKLAALADTDDTDLVGGAFFTETFSSAGSWVLGTGASDSGDVLSYTGGTSTDSYVLNAIPRNSQIAVTFTVSNYAAGNVKLRPGSLSSEGTAVSANGTYTQNMISTSNDAIVVDVSSNFVGDIDDIIVYECDPDRSVNNNGLIINGSITKTAVATGADLVAYSGFTNNTSYLEQPYNSDLDFGTGDFSVMGWGKSSGAASRTYVSYGTTTAKWQIQHDSSGLLRGYIGSDIASYAGINDGTWKHLAMVRSSGTMYLYVNGVEVDSLASATDATTADATLRFGLRHGDINTLDSGSLALWRISGTAPTADQIAKIYNDEKMLFQDSAKATLTGSSDAVTALAHDPDTNLLHVGTSGGRSVFQGLRRVDETATAVTTAISAVDGLVVEQ